MLQDALKKALAGASPAGLVASAPPPAGPAPAPAGAAALPGPEGSPWLELLARHRPVPAGASVGRLRQETDQLVKELDKSGNARAARELGQARDAYLKRRESEAWALVKTRWAELQLPERLYRRLKTEDDLPVERVLEKLHTKRAATFSGRAPEPVLAWLREKA